jgi:hypothetical protein
MTTPTTKASASDSNKVSAKKEASPGRWRVKLSHPLERERVVFSSISEKRARAFIERRYPRGEEAFLESPEGDTESYQAERTGPHGEDAEQWAEFDLAAYVPPEEQAPPGEAAWADVES